MLPSIVQSFRNSELTQRQLAEAVGLKEAAISKILSGSQTSMDPKSFRLMEIALGLDLFSIVKNGKFSPIAEQTAAMIDSDPLVAQLAACMIQAISASQATFTPRYVPTEEMAGLGTKILKICQDNPEKPGKIAKLVLQLLA